MAGKCDGGPFVLTVRVRVDDLVCPRLAPAVFLRAGDPRAVFVRLRDACVVLEGAVAAGLCTRWGVSSWETMPLGRVLGAGDQEAALPLPDVLMVCAGLAVGGDGLRGQRTCRGAAGDTGRGTVGNEPVRR